MVTVRYSSSRTRTRVLRTPQTHEACYTCKARKIRCDLGRPNCDRCTRASKTCGGYQYSVTSEVASCAVVCHSNGSQQTLTTPPTPLDFHNQSSEVASLVKLGCDVLHQGSVRQTGLASSFWSTVIPQLGSLDTLVGASMAAFGAAVHPCLISSPSKEIVYSRHCAAALRGIQQAVDSSIQSSVALIAACLLLSVSEILMDQELSALSHLQGMLLVLTQRQQPTLSPLGSPPGAESYFIMKDDVDVAGSILDISTSSYALGLDPRLPPLATNKGKDHDIGASDATATIERRTLTTLHSSYAFASKHNHWRYPPDRFVPKSAFVNQNYVCIELFQRIQEIGALITNLDDTQTCRAHILRAQCSTCLIYCLNLLEPRETGYDRFSSTFSAIVDDAEIVIRDQLSGGQSYFHFSLDLGVIQPLYFTAIKCRDRQIRMKAVSLLRQSGREGPFDGKRLAIVAQRAVDLESHIGTGIGSEENNGVAHVVAENDRIHSAGFESTRQPGMLQLGVPASFSRCRDIRALLETHSPDEYKKPEYWELWDELLPWTSGVDLDSM